jgi:transcriptional regulator with PAS, ATPase and Fis domain
LKEKLTNSTKSCIEQALEAAHGNKAKAAKILDISRLKIICRIEKYDIKVKNSD